ncbi:bifunctional tetrahydrofolate synthase/dihydrofolate synthase [Gilvimarinus agarilyticus]|uniref:bifunctional tetrahydrofolate synthase/dihydrofolate synthase n=1 Tax=Gilvimarinus agarilyticus TaxID=679259 RepID=UPI0009FCDD18|nr:bifunctional tetrahydrofolate synthase/dihydrofolate synthase [Gilvimarinus agarilyticus]
MGFTHLDDWLAWLEQAHPSEIDLGLDRVRQVLEQLPLGDLPPVITVAGTNGKGSCVAATSALLEAAGWRVGCYTSPHIVHYCERVRIAGKAVSEADMCRAFERVNTARGDTSLTYFEFGTLAALVLFCQQNVDVMVLEVGLGGRLDAVNVIAPDVAVITGIAIDHEAWLGNNRESIGREKAGIMRAQKPAICVDSDPPASLLQYAADIGAPLRLIGRDFIVQNMAGEDQPATGFNASAGPWRLLDVTTGTALEVPAVSLIVPSVVAAIEAVRALGVDVAAHGLLNVLQNLRLPGRMQRLNYGATPVLLDVAHNPAATAYLAEVVKRQKTKGRVVALVAMMADKDIAGALQPLFSLVDHWLALGLEDVPRAASADTLAAIIAQGGGQVTVCSGVAEGFAQLSSPLFADLDKDDLLLVFGSFFTVAAAMAILAPDMTAQLAGETK